MIFNKKMTSLFFSMFCLVLPLMAQPVLKFEKISLWSNGYTAKVTCINTSPSDTVSGWSLRFYMNAAIKNVSGAVYKAQGDTHIFVHDSWTKIILPRESVSFTFEGTYTGAFIPPKEGIFNGVSVPFHWVNISTNNAFCFSPATYYFKEESYKPLRDIQLGEARLWKVWAERADAKIPLNRKSWAMAMVHAHQLFRNATGVETLPLNSYFGTALKESFCGCDASIMADPGDAFPLRFHTSATGDGCFQIENGSAYMEMRRMYPQRFPAGGHAFLISGSNFETAALFKAYYDIFTVRLLHVHKGWNPQGFFSAAADPLATLKALAAAYNRGHWSNVVEELFHSKRAAALASKDLLDLLGKNSIVWDYARDISNFTLALGNQVSQLDTALSKTDPLTGLPYNRFYDYYNASITWKDVENYINTIAVLYPSENFTQIKNNVKTVFDQVNGGQAISFRYQFGRVLDKLILSLPVDDPTNNISSHYGCIGNLTTSKAVTGETWSAEEIKVYPNPSRGETSLSYFSKDAGRDVLEIYDVLGARIRSIPVERTTGENKIKIELPLCGIYVVKIIRGGSMSNAVRIMVTE